MLSHNFVHLYHQFLVQVHPVLLEPNSVLPPPPHSQVPFKPCLAQLRCWKWRCFGFEHRVYTHTHTPGLLQLTVCACEHVRSVWNRYKLNSKLTLTQISHVANKLPITWLHRAHNITQTVNKHIHWTRALHQPELKVLCLAVLCYAVCYQGPVQCYQSL